MEFFLKKKGGISYFCDKKICKTDKVSHIFSTRLGGVSSGDLFSMNLSPSRGTFSDTIENYKRLCSCENIPFEKCVLAQQTHTKNIRIVTEEDSGKPMFTSSDIKDTDGLVTNVKNLPIAIFFADCVPILLFDTEKVVLGVVHAGWRGTVEKIAENALSVMKENFSSNSEDVFAAIGPSIGPCCFNVSEDTKKEFEKANLKECIKIFGNSTYIDLQNANKIILERCGVKPENISILKMCTKCNKDIFFSHRGCGADTGRMALIGMLK